MRRRNVIREMYESHAIKASNISYQVDTAVKFQNKSKIDALLGQPCTQNQLQEAEKMIYALQLTKEDYPMADYIIDLLIEGIQRYKPSIPLLNKEIEEMLQAQRDNEQNGMSEQGITVDQNGLARMIAKQQIENDNCAKRLRDLKSSVKDVSIQLVKAQAMLVKLETETDALTKKLSCKASPPKPSPQEQ